MIWSKLFHLMALNFPDYYFICQNVIQKRRYRKTWINIGLTEVPLQWQYSQALRAGTVPHLSPHPRSRRSRCPTQSQQRESKRRANLQNRHLWLTLHIHPIPPWIKHVVYLKSNFICDDVHELIITIFAVKILAKGKKVAKWIELSLLFSCEYLVSSGNTSGYGSRIGWKSISCWFHSLKSPWN